MVTDLLQIVDSISATPTILADLNNREPLFIVKDGWSAPPPSLSRSSSRTSLVDGETVASSSYNDRVIEVKLGVDSDGLNDTHAALQVVERLLDRDGAWLKWQQTESAKPVFFRTKRAEITEYVEYNGTTPFKVAALRIPADPFAYGEKVSSTFTVSNSTFVKSWTDPVQGDVATPLWLAFSVPMPDHVTVAASVARPAGSVQSSPYIQSVAASGAASTATGWTITDLADGNVIAPTKRRVQRSTFGTIESKDVTPTGVSWPGLPQGEYRVMVRLTVAWGDVTVKFFGGAPVTGAVTPSLELPIKTSPVTGLEWHDLGVISLPANAPQGDRAFGLDAGISVTPSWWLQVETPGIADVHFDSIMLIPVGGPDVVSARCSMTRTALTTAAKTMYLDGVNDRRYVNRAGTFVTPEAVAGGLPVLVPGAANTLHLLVSAAVNAASKASADSKFTTTTVDYAYFPRYVGGFRPAAS